MNSVLGLKLDSGKLRTGLAAVFLMPVMFGPLSAFAGDYESVADDSVVGYWRFDDTKNYAADSSAAKSDVTGWSNGAAGKADPARGGGYLNVPKSGSNFGKATATLKGSRTPDISSATRGWTMATWIRGSESIFSLNFLQKLAIQASEDASAFYGALTDGKWHPIVVVFRPSLADSCYRIYVNPFDGSSVKDICSTDDTPGNCHWTFPVSFGGTSATLGGKIAGSGTGYSSMSADFFGDLDDCIILDRELKGGSQGSTGDSEVFRLVQTGETFVFSKSTSGKMFYEAGGWSNGLAPQEGLAYMIENGHEVKASKTAAFAGKSLSVGRTGKLYGVKAVGGSKELVVDNTIGKLTQIGVGTSLTVNDLRLNDGVLASMADGQALATDAKVASSAAKPFEINVSTGTYRITGRMTGGGFLVKRGVGTLDLSGLTELDAQIALESGTLRLPNETAGSIDYSGGDLIVARLDGQKPILIRNCSAWPVVCTVTGEFDAVGGTALFAVSNSVRKVSASDFAVTTTAALGLETKVRISQGDGVQLVWIDAEACERYVIGTDTFEDRSVGEGTTDLPGWSGTGSVIAAQPAIATPPSYALDGVGHTKALSVDEVVERTYANSFVRDNQIVDCLFQAYSGALNAAACSQSGVADGQTSLGVDEDGCICVYHPDASGAGVWSRLSFGSKSSFASGEWVRLTCVFDYCSNVNGHDFVQVRVNGNCGVSPDGVRSPTDATPNGSWFRLFDKGGAEDRKISELRVRGDTHLDDVVVSAYNKSVKPETHTCADTVVDYAGTYGSGKSVSGKIAYAQCDEKGIPRDVDFDSDGDGVSNGVELLKGTDPLDGNSYPGVGMTIILR